MKRLLVGLLLTLALIIAIPTPTMAHTVLPGDANQDGRVDIGDVLATEWMILGMRCLIPEADANQDGRIDIGDVLRIERLILTQ